ncbi:MAG: glycosyltransferase family 4 protein [Cyanothece sp. SIO2G6]|nr:glycosyltransferase family 4 protein [Cyanothece sp. SIO2G6]
MTPTPLHLWVPNLFEFKGGIQVYLQDFLLALEKTDKHSRLTIFDKLDTQNPTEQLQSEQFSFHFSGQIYQPFRTLHFSLNLFLGALFDHPKLIICGHLNFAPIALVLNAVFKIPYWILVYGVDAWDIDNPLKVQALKQAEKIISIGDYTRDRLLTKQKLSKDQIPLLPVTFDASDFSIEPKPQYLLERYGLAASQPIILTVARLSEADQYKGYDQILKALPAIRQAIPDVHYVLVGKGGDRPRVEALIKTLNLQDCVTLTGFVPDGELCDHYNLCDVFAMPSKGEGFGIVYLEALACGKPVLGGNQDGAIDALVNGELGVLVDPDDVDAITQTLTQILQREHSHPLLYQPEILRHKVVDYFGFEQFQKTLAHLLNDHFKTK